LPLGSQPRVEAIEHETVGAGALAKVHSRRGRSPWSRRRCGGRGRGLCRGCTGRRSGRRRGRGRCGGRQGEEGAQPVTAAVLALESVQFGPQRHAAKLKGSLRRSPFRARAGSPRRGPARPEAAAPRDKT